ncbi:MAG: alpha/beta fold hydrolase [Kiritimatiellia bacterium]
MQLAAVVHGPATARPPLVIAHGLFGSARNWGAVAKRLALHRRVIVVDMRNHGDSPRSPDHGYGALAGDLAATIAAHGGTADLLGHSMGGKAAMVLALTEPACVRRLIVADMAPVAYGHSQIGYVRAMQAVDLATVARRADAEAALATEVPEPGLRAFLLQNLAFDGPRPAWKLNLPVLGEQMPRIMGFPDLRARFEGPTLFLTGARSDYVRPAAWPQIRALFPAARHVELADAGHWLHAEAPRPFTEAVETFLET